MTESRTESGDRPSRWRLDAVMPVFNERGWVVRSADALDEAAAAADCDVRLIVVDDGSDDPESVRVLDDLSGRANVRLVRQHNQGRFVARSAGLALVETPHVLLLDARAEVEAQSLRRIREAIESRGVDVWNFDVAMGVRTLGALFWTGITKIWWRDYFRDKRPISFGVAEFDRFPKGTTAFFAPTEVLRQAEREFESAFADARLASDDTGLLRRVASQRPISVSPEIEVRHYIKTGARQWARQCYYRGTTFVDGYLGDPGKAELLLAAGLGAVAAGALVTVRAPRVAGAGLLAGSAAAAAATRYSGGTPSETGAVAMLTGPFVLLFGGGVLRGLRLASGAG